MADEVILRRWPKKEGGSVIAIFPYQISDHEGNVNSYEHVGQHGGASLGLINRTTSVKATDPDVKDLLAELRGIGYKPKVIQRVQHGKYSLALKKVQQTGGYTPPGSATPDPAALQGSQATRQRLVVGGIAAARPRMGGYTKTKAREYLWMRLGDSGDYEKVEDPTDAAEQILMHTGQVQANAIAWRGKYGVGVFPYFEEYNYISLFWGDNDAQPTRQLSKAERKAVETVLTAKQTNGTTKGYRHAVSGLPYKLPPTYHVDKIEPGHGPASFLEPPNHPRYGTQAIYTQYGNSPPPGQPQYLYKGRGFTTLEAIDKHFKPLPYDDPLVKMWEEDLYAYFHTCYSPDGKERSAAKCLTGVKPGDRPAEHHLAYMFVKKYYPDAKPRLDFIEHRPAWAKDRSKTYGVMVSEPKQTEGYEGPGTSRNQPFHYEGFTYSDGACYCPEHLPKGVKVDDNEVHPIFADSEWDSYPACDKCHKLFDYVQLTDEGRRYEAEQKRKQKGKHTKGYDPAADAAQGTKAMIGLGIGLGVASIGVGVLNRASERLHVGITKARRETVHKKSARNMSPATSKQAAHRVGKPLLLTRSGHKVKKHRGKVIR